MNIKQAKEEIKHTVQAYLAKDEFGGYRIPAIRQRPMLLIGPPGIGKTQIMEQIAAECGIGLVAYTITHHTRQSAVGLPFIREEEYDGRTYSVTEYTMSEIIASVYRTMRETGRKEGILFIDEINCVSETLAPTMLQFLQCKTFGNQAVPEGWIIVAAGNPPEYNRSVRDFDMVTLDRVRCMNIEADLSVWKEYARERHLQNAILSYLELRPKNFYRAEADIDGLRYVTARGWEDLSALMEVYESLGLPVTEEIIGEFLHHEDVAEDVAAYFDLYRKYQDDYGIAEILDGKVKSSVYARIYEAAFDERLSVVNLLLGALGNQFREVAEETFVTDHWYTFLQQYQELLQRETDGKELFRRMLEQKLAEDEQNEKNHFVSAEETRWQKMLNEKLKQTLRNLPENPSFDDVKIPFEMQCDRLDDAEQKGTEKLENAFSFMENAFENGQEMVVFVTELAVTPEIARFLADHPCARFERYREELLVGTRRAELLSELRRDEN